MENIDSEWNENLDRLRGKSGIHILVNDNKDIISKLINALADVEGLPADLNDPLSLEEAQAVNSYAAVLCHFFGEGLEIAEAMLVGEKVKQAYLGIQDETGNTKKQWLVFEKAMKEERKANKYYALIEKAMYTTDQEADEYFTIQNKRIKISFVAKRYADIPDSSVVTNESDIEAYYEEHKNEFEEKKSRKIEYSMFEIVPSSIDSAAIKEWVDETYVKFKLTKDDSTFVNAHSDKEFDYRFYSRNDENIEIDTSLFNEDSIKCQLQVQR